MNGLIRWVMDLLYPPKCMLCHRLLESSDAPTCGRCEYDLPECGQVQNKVQFCEQAISPFHYEGYVRDAILRFKFHGMQEYAQQFAVWMAARVQGELKSEPEVISWVPCSARRKWERGFDQAELLAKALSKQLELPCEAALKKIRHTKKQSTLRDASRRRANVLGAYRVIDPENVSGRRILLVDDVLTTGATMSECAKTLLLAGAQKPIGVSVAAARRNREKRV